MVKTATKTIEPHKNAPIKLDKPGAGLPLIERLYLNWYIKPFVAGKEDWAKTREDFISLNERLTGLIEPVPYDKREKQILIDHVRGLEDSSRYWSLAMTLEHLVICHDLMRGVLESLKNGTPPTQSISTADVKPKGLLSGEIALDEYRKACDKIIAVSKTIEPVHDTIGGTAPHPWFGPLTLKQWHWVIYAHTVVHFKQIKQIIKKL